MVKIKTGPAPPIFPPSKPEFFYRVTDSTSYFQRGTVARTGAPDPHGAFNFDGPDPCFKFGLVCMPISADTILWHLEGKVAEGGDRGGGKWGWFISVYDNKEEVKGEVDKRKAMGRKDIKTWRIDGRGMYWKKDALNKVQEDGQVVEVEVDVLTDFMSDFGYPVMFISVTELVSKLGLEGRLEGRGVGGEWVALEWIPGERIKLLQAFSS